MTHRTDRVWIPDHEARCVPENECLQRETCARWLASLPPSGATMQGAGLPPSWSPDRCMHHWPVSWAKPPAPQQRRVVKPPIKGIA